MLRTGLPFDVPTQGLSGEERASAEGALCHALNRVLGRVEMNLGGRCEKAVRPGTVLSELLAGGKSAVALVAFVVQPWTSICISTRGRLQRSDQAPPPVNVLEARQRPSRFEAG